MDNYRERMMMMLGLMAEKGASDLHLSVDVQPFMRINGVVAPMSIPPLSKEECENVIFSLLTEEGRESYFKLKTLDFAFGEDSTGRFRINIYQQQGSIAAAIRRLPMKVPSFEKLGLPVESMKRFCTRAHGLVLVCGPVGSGKTTTLASMVDYINSTRSCHIITIEDPVEYVHRNARSLIHQREIRRDTPNFVDALKFILREDPDVVVIGEMRDLETISSAITIAETGHLVLATLHTGDASESIRRMIDVFPHVQQAQVITQLSGMLAGVINQILIPSLDGNSRVLATEVMMVTPAIQNLIRENKIEQIYSHILMGSNLSMHTLNQSLASLVYRGAITRDAAINRTTNPKELIKLLERK